MYSWILKLNSLPLEFPWSTKKFPEYSRIFLISSFLILQDIPVFLSRHPDKTILTSWYVISVYHVD